MTGFHNNRNMNHTSYWEVVSICQKQSYLKCNIYSDSILFMEAGGENNACRTAVSGLLCQFRHEWIVLNVLYSKENF